MREHERVILTAAVPSEGLVPGDVGTVVHVYQNGAVFEVEFATLDGNTMAVVTLEASQLRPVGSRDILHAREMTGK